MAAAVPKPAPDASTLVADPRAWRFFPDIGKVDVRRGAVSFDADVKDALPLVDLGATWIAQPVAPASQPGRWLASAGVTHARASDAQTRRAAPRRSRR